MSFKKYGLSDGVQGPITGGQTVGFCGPNATLDKATGKCNCNPGWKRGSENLCTISTDAIEKQLPDSTNPCPCDCSVQDGFEDMYITEKCDGPDCIPFIATETKKVCNQPPSTSGQYKLTCDDLKKSLGSNYTLSGCGCTGDCNHSALNGFGNLANDMVLDTSERVGLPANTNVQKAGFNIPDKWVDYGIAFGIGVASILAYEHLIKPRMKK